jgi:hypothetical protein
MVWGINEPMSKKSISSDDLIWRIHEELGTSGQTRLSLAVIPDPKLGFRVLVARRSKLLPALRVRLSAIEERFQKEYVLR